MTMKFIGITTIALITAGCVVPPPSTDQFQKELNCPADSKTSSAFNTLTGQNVETLSTYLIPEANRIGPDDAPLTLDLREDRLTVIYDENKLITAIGCY